MSVVQGIDDQEDDMGASKAGWQRLAADLNAAGYGVSLVERPYTEERYGRIEHGVSRSIHFQVLTGAGVIGFVTVDDKEGRGGKWYGWSVTAEGRDSIVIGRPSYAVTDRSQIVKNFKAAVAAVTKKAQA